MTQSIIPALLYWNETDAGESPRVCGQLPWWMLWAVSIDQDLTSNKVEGLRNATLDCPLTTIYMHAMPCVHVRVCVYAHVHAHTHTHPHNTHVSTWISYFWGNGLLEGMWKHRPCATEDTEQGIFLLPWFCATAFGTQQKSKCVPWHLARLWISILSIHGLL